MRQCNYGSWHSCQRLYILLVGYCNLLYEICSDATSAEWQDYPMYFHKHDSKSPRKHDGKTRQALFAAWLAEKKIITSGIQYQWVPGKGLGIVAQRRLEVLPPVQPGL